MFKYKIRECTPGDERLLSIVAQAMIFETYAPLVHGVNLYQYAIEELGVERFQTFLADRTMRIWAAEIDPTGAIVGYAHVVPDVRDPFALELKRMYLFHRFRNEGIGKRLTDQSIAFAQQRGSQAVLIRVHQKDEAAIGFYLGYGFQAIGEEEFTAGDEVAKVVLMRLTLARTPLQ